MVSIFSTAKSKAFQISNINDEKIKDFDLSLNKVLLNLAKRVVADGEGASKFITINIDNCINENDAKKIAFRLLILLSKNCNSRRRSKLGKNCYGNRKIWSNIKH